MGLKLKCGFLTALTLAASMAGADTLELKNGSLIKGKFLGGTETEISFQVGSTAQNITSLTSLRSSSIRKSQQVHLRRSRRVRFRTIRGRQRMSK
jgi:hypothetical protein